MTYSKEEKREYNKKYYELNKEKISEKKAEYNEKNKEKRAEYRRVNKEKRLEYNKKYRELNREKIREQDKVHRDERRAICREYLGGKCVVCGTTHNLQFDHIKREGKKYEISTKLSYNFDTLKEEVNKCQLLCVDCHKIKTKSELTK